MGESWFVAVSLEAEMSAAKYLVVMTTCAGDEEATRLAQALVEKKLAACVQASHIISTYRWQGAVEIAPEVRLMIKARAADYDAIAALIAALHSYENPEILAIAVAAGAQPYLDWIDQV
jgi:periplasmic divalent cation tolerance protein